MKPILYRELLQQMQGLLAGERDALANMANASALMMAGLPELNWVGFYLMKRNQLVLGPFQGNVACVRIPLGSGVCGTAAQRRESIIVPDVHDFPGHIACDAASQSEIVLPLIHHGRLLGVLDLDSPKAARFDSEDQTGLSCIVELLVEASDFSELVGVDSPPVSFAPSLASVHRS